MQPMLEVRPEGGGSLQAGEVWRAEDCNESLQLTGGFLPWFVCLDTIVISTHSVWETGEAKCFFLSWASSKMGLLWVTFTLSVENEFRG